MGGVQEVPAGIEVNVELLVRDRFGNRLSVMVTAEGDPGEFGVVQLDIFHQISIPNQFFTRIPMTNEIPDTPIEMNAISLNRGPKGRFFATEV